MSSYPPPPDGGWGPPPGGGWGPRPAQQTNSKATAALVLGICGIAVCPLVCSILALVFGYQARNEIDASGGYQGGRGSAVAGIVLGWVGVAVTALAIIAWVVLVVAAGTSSSSV